MTTNSTTKSTQNQSVNSLRAMYYALCDMGEVLTPEARRNARKSNPRTERRSSKPKKGAATNVDVLNLYFEKSAAKVFHLGRKSDMLASAEPTDRMSTVVMIGGIPHKKDGNGGYKALTLQSTGEAGVTEMYQHLLLLAEGRSGEAAMYEQLLALSTCEE